MYENLLDSFMTDLRRTISINEICDAKAVDPSHINCNVDSNINYRKGYNKAAEDYNIRLDLFCNIAEERLRLALGINEVESNE